MNNAKEHYDRHFGAIYSWMAGDVNVAWERNRSLFHQLGLDTALKGLAEVHDLLYYKEGTQWVFKASSYCKLRLDKNWLIKQMGELGLVIIQDTFDGGMVNIVAKKIGSA